MTYNDTSNANGIIQMTERYADLGSTYISASTDRLKEFTSYANEVGGELWFIAFNNCGGWQWDDSNNTDLPQSTTNIVSGQNRYAIPSEALTISRLEVKDANGSWVKLAPFLKEKERLAISDLEEKSGTPTHYFLVNDTIQLYPKPDYASTNGLKVYFDRNAVDFAYNDTTKTPGIPSPFHGLYPLGMAITWLKIKQPTHPSLAIYVNDYEKGKNDMAEYFVNRWKDNTPTLITKREENFE